MGTGRHAADPPADDPLTLLALGGLAYLLTMLVHEGVGHSPLIGPGLIIRR